MREVVVRIDARPIPPQLFGRNMSGDAAFRAGVQEWWETKDRLLDDLLSPAAQAARRG